MYMYNICNFNYCTYTCIHSSNLQEEEEEEEEQFEHRASKRPRSDFIQDEAGDCYIVFNMYMYLMKHCEFLFLHTEETDDEEEEYIDEEEEGFKKILGRIDKCMSSTCI